MSVRKPQYKDLPIAQIVIGERVRPVDQDVITDILVPSIDEIGLQNPIVVRRHKNQTDNYILVSGAHRLAAFKQLERETIPASILDIGSDRAIMAEIDENILRKQFTALEMAEALFERQRVFLKQNPDKLRGGDRRSSDFQTAQNAVWSFVDDAGECIGLRERQIYKYLTAAKLPKQARDMLRGTGHDQKLQALLVLADFHGAKPDKLEDVIKLIVDKTDPVSLDEAIRIYSDVTPKTKTPADTFLGKFDRASEKEQGEAVKTLMSVPEFSEAVIKQGIPGYKIIRDAV